MKLLMVNVGEGRYAVPADAVEQIVDPALEGDFHLEESEAVFRGERFPLVDLHAAAGERRGPAPVYLVLHWGRRRAVIAGGRAQAIRGGSAGGTGPPPGLIFPPPPGALPGVLP